MPPDSGHVCRNRPNFGRYLAESGQSLAKVGPNSTIRLRPESAQFGQASTPFGPSLSNAGVRGQGPPHYLSRRKRRRREGGGSLKATRQGRDEARQRRQGETKADADNEKRRAVARRRPAGRGGQTEEGGREEECLRTPCYSACSLPSSRRVADTPREGGSKSSIFQKMGTKKARPDRPTAPPEPRTEARMPENPRAVLPSRRERRAKADTSSAGRRQDSGAQPHLPNHRVAPAQFLESRQR